MRSRATASDHEAAVARRLELLTSELAGVRGERASPAPRPRLVPVAEPDTPLPQAVLVPGRHASRRLARGVTGPLARSLPDTLRGRVWLGAGQLAVVAVVAAVGLAVTCWWLVRGGSHQVSVPLAVTSPHAALATPAGRAAGPPAALTSTSRGPRWWWT
jgi:competence protein ComEA